MSISFQPIKVGFISALSGGVLFTIICAVFHINDFKHLSLAAAIGAFSGLVAAPEFSPESYKNPIWFQTISGALSGLFLAIFFNWEAEIIWVSILVGAVLGYTAKYWVDHVPVP